MERPTFYAVIPAHVRYSSITAMAKLLYGEITALCEKEGFCWAGNGYFAKLYDAGERSVRRWLDELVSAEFIEIDAAVNQYGQRRIFIAWPNLAGQKWPAKNVLHNNTRIENDTREEIPSVSPQPTKATKHASLPLTSVGEFIGDSEIIPADWFNAISIKHRWQPAFIDEQWQRFCNHHIGKGTRWRDWKRAWLNWCAGTKVGPGGGSNGSSLDRGLAGAMRASVAQRHGATQPGGGVGGGTSTGGASADSGGTRPTVPAGEIPF